MASNLIRSNLLFFDVEYANSRNKSICQMGLMVEDAISKEPTYPELNIYVNPNDDFDKRCVDVHHITKDRVSNEKSFDMIWKDIEKYFINSVIVGHNVRGSDLDALCKNLIRYDIPLPEFYYIDTYEIAKECISPTEVSNYKLSTLFEYFDISIDCEHDAFDDACACSDLLIKMTNTFNIELQDFIRHFEFEKNFLFLPYLDEISAIREMNFLLGKTRGFLADGTINDDEKELLKSWKKDHISLVVNQFGKEVIECVDNILLDDVLTLDEVKQLEKLLVNISQNFSASIETKATQELQGMVAGIVADNEIDELELMSLQKWMYKNDYLIGHYPYDKIKYAIEKVIEDHIVTIEEKDSLLKLFDDLFNPVKDAINNLVIFEDREFCLSGEFSHGAKKDVENHIIQNGGIVSSNVRKKTDYVVVGEYGSASYANENYGTKVKKAMEIGVTVITEKQLYNEL